MGSNTLLCASYPSTFTSSPGVSPASAIAWEAEIAMGSLLQNTTSTSGLAVMMSCMQEYAISGSDCPDNSAAMVQPPSSSVSLNPSLLTILVLEGSTVIIAAFLDWASVRLSRT